jgi:predicted HTH domain antitoxin
MLLFLAVKCYQRSLLSIGKAAELAGMDKVDFEIYLSENKIPVSNLDYSDVYGDLEKLKI